MAKPTKPEPFSVLTGLRETFTGIDPAIRLNRVWTCCLQDMVDLFRPICDAVDDADLLRSSTILAAKYVHALGGETEDALRTAWARTMATHKLKRWPTIAEIRKHVPAKGNAAPVSAGDRVRRATAEEAKMLRELGYESMTQIRESDLPKYRSMLQEREQRKKASWWVDIGRA